VHGDWKRRREVVTIGYKTTVDTHSGFLKRGLHDRLEREDKHITLFFMFG